MTQPPNKRNIIHPIISRLTMHDISLPLANTLYNISNFVLICGAILVLVGTWGATTMGSRREHFTDLRITENETKTATANAAAESAKAAAAQATENTEVIRASNLKLQKNLETERFERMTLEASLSPRRLKPEEKAALIAALKPFKGQKVLISSALADAEARHFRDDFVEVFDAAGWDHDGPRGLRESIWQPPLTGLSVGIHMANATLGVSNPAIEALLKSLAELGLTPTNIPDGEDGVDAGSVSIRVGGRTPLPIKTSPK